MSIASHPSIHEGKGHYLLEDEDLVSVDDGRQAVGDGQHGALLAHLGQRRLNVPLRLGIKRRRGLVQQHDFRVLGVTPL